MIFIDSFFPCCITIAICDVRYTHAKQITDGTGSKQADAHPYVQAPPVRRKPGMSGNEQYKAHVVEIALSDRGKNSGQLTESGTAETPGKGKLMHCPEFFNEGEK